MFGMLGAFIEIDSYYVLYGFFGFLGFFGLGNKKIPLKYWRYLTLLWLSLYFQWDASLVGSPTVIINWGHSQ